VYDLHMRGLLLLQNKQKEGQRWGWNNRAFWQLKLHRCSVVGIETHYVTALSANECICAVCNACAVVQGPAEVCVQTRILGESVASPTNIIWRPVFIRRWVRSRF